MTARRHRLAWQHTQTEARATSYCAPVRREETDAAPLHLRQP
jgi:hypothetical protein